MKTFRVRVPLPPRIHVYAIDLSDSPGIRTPAETRPDRRTYTFRRTARDGWTCRVKSRTGTGAVIPGTLRALLRWVFSVKRFAGDPLAIEGREVR